MRLLIIRHGTAGDREEWEAEGRDDRLRPLTSEGKKEVRKAVAGLAELVPTLDVLATSPLTRAAETADIVAARYGCAIQLLDALAPDSEPDLLMDWLQHQQPTHTICAVGHEPHLSTLAAYLLTGRPASFLDLKKGGACLLELDVPPAPGSGTLRWLLTNSLLRRL